MIIGIIEDDKLLNQALRLVLQKAGYRITCAHTRQEALSLMGREEDLLLVDIGLPEEQDMLAAFDTGADDYVVKPFSMKVLLKRIETVLKRNNEKERISYRELLLFPAGKQVFVEGREIRLTAKEYQLLEYLMLNQGQVLTKEMILEKIWGLEGQFVVDNTVSVTINRLRKKLEPDAGQSSYIKNVFGLGYRIGDK